MEKEELTKVSVWVTGNGNDFWFTCGPPIGIPLTCPSMGYHLRAGQHDILPQDWAYYLDFMQRYLP